ncbi:ParB/RepB/Spo0J family partition protein [Paenibacillus enshidis]|uniref:ParB/RepB/Spo0J family partition protein n=1 Tax=Paenibacillus enshidis TaxID=1458439 RepID=A0ABV5B0D1_9BACL
MIEISDKVIHRSVLTLKKHPQHELYNSPLTAAELAALEDSIAKTGIQEALLIRTDGTIISGHHRRSLAMSLGLPEVPVREVCCDPTEALYLLVASNEAGRGKKETDLMKKARRVQVLYEFGRSKGWNAPYGFGEAGKLSEEEYAVKRLIKLLYLLPKLQREVSAGRIGQQAAYKVAGLSQLQQKKFLAAYEMRGVMSSKEIQKLVEELDDYEPRVLRNAEKKKENIRKLKDRVANDLTFLMSEAIEDDELQGELIDLLEPKLFTLLRH